MKNLDKQFILTYLKSLDFDDTSKKGFGGHNRLTHNKITKGSLYVGDAYISGTGVYAKIKEKILPFSFDRHNYPEWKEDNILQLLNYLESSFLTNHSTWPLTRQVNLRVRCRLPSFYCS